LVMTLKRLILLVEINISNYAKRCKQMRLIEEESHANSRTPAAAFPGQVRFVRDFQSRMMALLRRWFWPLANQWEAQHETVGRFW